MDEKTRTVLAPRAWGTTAGALVADPAHLRDHARGLDRAAAQAGSFRRQLGVVLSGLLGAGAARAPGWRALEEDRRP